MYDFMVDFSVGVVTTGRLLAHGLDLCNSALAVTNGCIQLDIEESNETRKNEEDLSRVLKDVLGHEKSILCDSDFLKN